MSEGLKIQHFVLISFFNSFPTVTEQKEWLYGIRKRLKCNSFQWYLDNVARTLPQHKVETGFILFNLIIPGQEEFC
jgi:hypothetical protein